jgi:hypothetical protein
MKLSLSDTACDSRWIVLLGSDLYSRAQQILDLPLYVAEFRTPDSWMLLFSQDRCEFDTFVRARTPERTSVELIYASVQVYRDMEERHNRMGRSVLDLVYNIFAEVAILTCPR